jgi:hypothetical protein
LETILNTIYQAFSKSKIQAATPADRLLAERRILIFFREGLRTGANKA